MDRLMRIGIDPGETTGLAAFIGPKILDSFEIPGGLEGFLEWWCDNIDHGCLSIADELIVEDFIVQPSFVGRPVASEIIGAIKALWSGQLTLQPRSLKATLFNQAKKGDAGEPERFAWLEERGFKRVGNGHNLDAVTHVLVNQKRNKDFWQKYWAD